MRAGHASRTAQHNAFFRALETSRPASRRVVEDPLARVFLTGALSLVARLAVLPGIRSFVPWFIDRRWPGVRTSLAARTRLIDDAIADALGAGIEQFVVLGAGFDSRAYRLPGLRHLSVFEVDHPDTQAAKRRALARALGGLPERVHFVATDFTTSDLESRMAAAGHRESATSFILWEGVTNYLDETAVDATLRWCSRAAVGSRLLFTYIHRDVLIDPGAFFGAERVLASLRRVGEPFTFGMDPGQLPAFLADRGLLLESDVGAAEYRGRYYREAARKIRGYEFYRVALARVAGRAARGGGESPAAPSDMR